MLPRPMVSERVGLLAEVEPEFALAGLRAVDGNKTRAAAELGIGAATLFRKLKVYEGRGLGR